MKFYCSNPQNKGLGDWIEGRTHTFGLDKLAHWFATKILGRAGCGCPNRRNQLNTLYPCGVPKLTIGIPTYNDFEGLWGTVTSIVEQADTAGLLDVIEILVIDQSPDPGPDKDGKAPDPQAVQAGEKGKDFIEGWVNGTRGKLKARYIRFNHELGTTVAKTLVFQASQTEWTMCIDSHVTLVENSLENVYRWICKNRTSRDLYHGVLVYDGFKTVSTHLEPVWRGQMWGTWASDERGEKPSMEPFEIPAGAGWAFMCRTDSWLGYHPLMRGFGGEETFLQKLWQKAGRKTFCLPCFRGIHRFGRTAQMAPVRVEDKIRNAALGLQMLGLPLDEMRDHFAVPFEEDGQMKVHADENLVDIVIAGAVSEHMNYISHVEGQQADFEQFQHAPKSPPTLEQVYDRYCALPSDINEHLPTLKKYAEECDHVTEFGTRSGVSTAALLLAQPKVLHTWDKKQQCPCKSLKSLAGSTKFEALEGDVVQIDPIEETDLLFIDTYHNSEQLSVELGLHAKRVRKYIIMHDTTTFWEHGEVYHGDGPKTGLKYATEEFLETHPQWSIKERFENNNGLLILEKTDATSGDNGSGQIGNVVSGEAAG